MQYPIRNRVVPFPCGQIRRIAVWIDGKASWRAGHASFSFGKVAYFCFRHHNLRQNDQAPCISIRSVKSRSKSFMCLKIPNPEL